MGAWRVHQVQSLRSRQHWHVAVSSGFWAPSRCEKATHVPSDVAWSAAGSRWNTGRCSRRIGGLGCSGRRAARDGDRGRPAGR